MKVSLKSKWGILIAAVAGFAFAFGAIAWSAIPHASADHVVSVVLKCDTPVQVGKNTEGYAQTQYREGTGADCVRTGAAVSLVRNRRQVITVRRPDGKTYMVEVPDDQTVLYDDTWPPK